MILSVLVAFLSVSEPQSRQRRGMFDITKEQRWDKVIPYVIDNRLFVDGVLEGMRIWTNRTGGNLKFVPRTNEPDYIDFVFSPDACNAGLGRSQGANTVNLVYACSTNILDVVHELGHKLGLQHEHQRSDRDLFIEIVTANIIPSFLFAFDKVTSSNNLTPYDFTSTMHYENTAFTANGLPTIVGRDPNKKAPTGKQPLSDYDVWAVCRFYEFDGCRFDNPNILNELGPTVPKTTTTTTTSSITTTTSVPVTTTGGPVTTTTSTQQSSTKTTTSTGPTNTRIPNDASIAAGAGPFGAVLALFAIIFI